MIVMDFLELSRIEWVQQQSAGSLTDVFSFVKARNKDGCLLFNNFVALKELREGRDHGNYCPFLKAAPILP